MFATDGTVLVFGKFEKDETLAVLPLFERVEEGVTLLL